MSEAEDKSRQPVIPQEEVRRPEMMYDRTDLTARGIVLFLIVLAVAVIFIHLIAWSLVGYFAKSQQEPAPPRNAAIVAPPKQPGARGDPALRFPAPRLQPDPAADLNKFRRGQEQQLNGYAWVDQKAGTVRIPIERAMDVLSQQGLPVRPAPTLPPRAEFGSGDGSAAGAGGGTEPKGNQ